MNVLVTGGGGFLGKALIGKLLEQGHQVRSFSRNQYAELADWGVEQISGDLADPAAVATATQGCDLVFHVAARAGIWGPRDAYEQTNVAGTRHVVTACRTHGVPRLVYTSSPSVVFAGSDLEGATEAIPYPKTYLAHYPRTKAEAERLVLAANGPQLATVALRPHLIWGPGDNHLVPRILARGRRGQLRRLGRRNPLIDTTYIDDAVSAHLCAMERLAPGKPCAGKAYFISSGQPQPLWDVVNGILDAGGLPPVTKTIPVRLAYAAGAILEGIYSLLGWQDEPRMTRFLAKELSTTHWFDLTAARRDLGYQPQFTFSDGLSRLRTALQQAVK